MPVTPLIIDQLQDSDAIFSADRVYRYVLWRIWDRSKPMVCFIGLNPSTADERKNDPTMRRCMGFAKSWGYGGFFMTNLFGYRATAPQDLKQATEPVGADNDKWLLEVQRISDKVVLAWGVHGTYKQRNSAVLHLFEAPYCMGTSKEGHPRHPLYLKKDQPLLPYKPNKLSL